MHFTKGPIYGYVDKLFFSLLTEHLMYNLNNLLLINFVFKQLNFLDRAKTKPRKNSMLGYHIGFNMPPT